MVNNKKKTITVSLNDVELSDRFYQEFFIYGIQNDKLSLSSEYVLVEMEDAIYKMRIIDLGYRFDPSFVHIYKEDLPKAIKSENLDPTSMKYVYQWTNPVIENMGVPYVTQFINDLKNKIVESNTYWMRIRSVSLSYVSSLELKERKKYIDRFSEFGIFVEKDKIALGYYSDEPISKIEQLIGNGVIEEDDIPIVVSQIYSYEREAEEDRQKENKKRKTKYNSRIVNAMNLLQGHDIVDVYLNDGLNDEEFFKTKVRKDDIFLIQYAGLVTFLEEKNDRMPERLKITSKDLVNRYGRNFNGSTIFKLATYGYINPKDLVEIFEINKALRTTGFEQDQMFEDEELKAYYTPQILMNMKDSGELDPEFIQKYIEIQDFENDKENFRLQSKKLITGLTIILRDRDIRNGEQEQNREIDKLQDYVLYFFDIGFCDTESAKKVISSEYIENKFINDELSIEKIFEFYKRGLIDSKTISKFYSDNELLELYENGEIDSDCLMAIDDQDLIIEGFCDEKIEIQDFMKLYLKSGKLSVSDLKDAIEYTGKDIDISPFIDESVPFEKIKELFQNLLIDYSTVLTLHAQGIIDDLQLEDLRKALNTRKLFESINSGKSFKVVTSRESETPEIKKDPVKRKKKDEDFSLELGLISRLLHKKDVENEPYATIESYNEKGRQTSLNEYRVFGNESLDGIVILQKSKRENAVYIMSAYQLMYFLNGKENEEGQIVAPNRMKDKAYLRTIVGVEVIEHTREFARNLVEASARISPKIAKSIRDEDSKYVKDVEKMISDLRTKYIEDKARDND